MKIKAKVAYTIGLLIILAVVLYGMFTPNVNLPGLPHFSPSQKEVRVVATAGVACFGLCAGDISIKSVTVNPVAVCTPSQPTGREGSWVVLEVYRYGEDYPFYKVTASQCVRNWWDWGCQQDYEFILCLEPGTYVLKWHAFGAVVSKTINVPR